jgi:hypothetical protein
MINTLWRITSGAAYLYHEIEEKKKKKKKKQTLVASNPQQIVFGVNLGEG